MFVMSTARVLAYEPCPNLDPSLKVLDGVREPLDFLVSSEKEGRVTTGFVRMDVVLN